MKKFYTIAFILFCLQTSAQDLVWNTSPIADNSTSFDFGPIGTPASGVNYALTGSGTITGGPARFTTSQGDQTWRTAASFASSSEEIIFTFTFAKAVCGLTFTIYDIDGDNASGGDRAIVTADNSGTAQLITLTALDATPPTIAGSGTTSASAAGTQGNQSDDRVEVTISGCVTTLTIKYSNNPAGPLGGRSFSIGNLSWTSLQSPEDLVWNTTAIPDNSTSYNFGSIGNPASTVNYSVSGPGSFDLGPLRFTTIQNTDTWRTRSTFAAVNDLNTYTFTFSPGVCDLSFLLYDIDGNNTSGDRAIVTATNGATPQTILMNTFDASPPTITGSGTTAATATGTQGDQTDDRVGVTILGCVTTLTIQYGNNPAGVAGQRSFSIGNFTWSGNTLPVNFLTFTGQKSANGAVDLTWSTENELNIAKYEIERSTDAQNFTSVGTVSPLNRAASYTFSDYSAPQGTLFYRIKQTDTDGKFKYSTTVALRTKQGQPFGITLFPNPASSSLFITSNNNTLIDRIQFFDITGKLVMQKQGHQNKIDISNLAKGLYRVKIIDRTGDIATGSFLKQ